MLVSWNWLKQYVPLTMSPRELEQRLMMAGLNHEETHEVGDDLAIDLEVTSNRPDCLGHIGIAREVSVLWQSALTIPAARPAEGKTRVEDLVRVRIDCPDLCTRYLARVVRGVNVGPSPDWLTKRLATIGIAAVNNVVDTSNYVMMECGQPLHTFDYARLRKGVRSILAEAEAENRSDPFSEIIVRRGRPEETIEAIDHKTYRIDPDMCLIADAQQPVAIAGVMGGAATEVNETTRDVLIEAADFDPISVRTTARRLSLHSDSSYRFERRVDPQGIDWASRRCAELILELAGGELAAGVVDAGAQLELRQPIVLRLSQLKRILGIEIEAAVVERILTALGNVEIKEKSAPHSASSSVEIAKPESLIYVPPTWRRDLSREIDLIEEVARIHGYDKIPEDVKVAMAASSRSRDDRAVAKLRTVLTAAGFDEAMTLSAVDEASARRVQAWTQGEPLRSQTPVIRGADYLRTSLVPSLLGVRRTNESLSNPVIELFEIARIYLPGAGLPTEWMMLGISSGRPLAEVKGLIEALVAAIDPKTQRSQRNISYENAEMPLLDRQASCTVHLNGQLLGYVGQLSAEGQKQSDLRTASVAAELRLAPLFDEADLIPQYVPLPAFPAVSRDLNLVVEETVRWAQIAATVRRNGGTELESLDYRDTYRDAQRLGGGKKSFLFGIGLRSPSGTLTSQQADDVRDRIVAACRQEHGSELRA